MITNLKAEDQRMVWLKDQYLFLYYQDDLCMGPLAADAIKVPYKMLFLVEKGRLFLVFIMILQTFAALTMV